MAVRKRSTAKNKNKRAPKPANESAPPSTTEDPDENMTAMAVIKGHWSTPFYVITAIVMTPYLIYLGYLHLRLVRPDLVSQATFGLVSLRPAVGLTDPRQVLIVGTISGGTAQAAEDLSRYFNLEVAHEASDSSSEFCRDGTSSWFHGIRFMPRPQDMTKSLFLLCGDFRDSMGFHPKMYRDTSGCSAREKWSRCWASECLRLLGSEWGCALPETEGTCETPFVKSLHQVRNPIHTIESLVAKFCRGDKAGTIDPAFDTFANALFPSHNFTSYSCIEAASYFVIEYHRAMLNAGDLFSKRYRIEVTSPCELADFAGFLDQDALYAPSHKQTLSVCNHDTSDNPAKSYMKSTKNRVNKGQIELEESDLLGGAHGSKRPEGDTTLLQQVALLMKDLDYPFIL